MSFESQIIKSSQIRESLRHSVHQNNTRQSVPALAAAAEIDRQSMSRAEPPQSWKNPERHLDTLLQSPWYKYLGDVIAVISDATHSFFRAHGARAALLPVTTGAVSSPIGLGSDSSPVKILLGGREQYLADSMQFLLEVAVRLHRCPVYYIMPSFRGEAIDDRHLNQFFHIEAEIPGGLEDVMNLVERYLRSVAAQVIEESSVAVEQLAGGIEHVTELAESRKAFTRIRFDEAVHLLKDNDAYVAVRDGIKSLAPEGEQQLLRRFGQFTWLTHTPHLGTPFYQAREPGTVYSLTADLLAGIGEIVGSGARAHDAEGVRIALQEHGVPEESYSWYVAMKEQYPMKTAGFGMGLERFLLWLTRTRDIRNCMLLLRDNTKDLLP